ncbi:hypothetical protein [Spirosoma endbachense]|uniref:Uncharacterized protein n=1 Tax=Spirosoma endbachense TaxID=2666025 RepID=A0A6P1VXF5_9BACT|nr:hypothetical protein [Spirosoma endbachense]QHV97871.1 hypothetical protein GJR95_23955 [Spirosoma endbachense]
MILLDDIIARYQAGTLAGLPRKELLEAQRKVTTYLGWHQQNPDFSHPVVPTADDLQPIHELLETTLNTRFGLDGMTPTEP